MSWCVYVTSGNMGLCGSIPSGLKVLQKVGGTDTAPALYLNNKPCPVSADTQIQSSGSRPGSSEVMPPVSYLALSRCMCWCYCIAAAIASAGLQTWKSLLHFGLFRGVPDCGTTAYRKLHSAAIRLSRKGALQAGASPNLGAIIGGVVGGVTALAAITAAVLFLVLRRRRRSAGARRSHGMKDWWQTMHGDEKVCTQATEHATRFGP